MWEISEQSNEAEEEEGRGTFEGDRSMVTSCGKVSWVARVVTVRKMPLSSPASSLFFASFFTVPGFPLSLVSMFHHIPFFFALAISLSAFRCWLRAVRCIVVEAWT